jgi:hypothetical protein
MKNLPLLNGEWKGLYADPGHVGKRREPIVHGMKGRMACLTFCCDWSMRKKGGKKGENVFTWDGRENGVINESVTGLVQDVREEKRVCMNEGKGINA